MRYELTIIAYLRGALWGVCIFTAGDGIYTYERRIENARLADMPLTIPQGLSLGTTVLVEIIGAYIMARALDRILAIRAERITASMTRASGQAAAVGSREI